jgi:hypothetical protein
LIVDVRPARSYVNSVLRLSGSVIDAIRPRAS